jgi:electron transfer flavoprotein beta subunit
MNALEMALSLKDRHGGRVSILSMGPPFFEPYLRVGLAMGADHIYLLSDRSFAGADTLATTYALAEGGRKIGGVDLVFCGEESSDGATGQVPSGLAEWLDLPQLTLLTQVSVDIAGRTATGRREFKGGYEMLEAPLPCVISVKTAVNEPRFMDYHIKHRAFGEGFLTVWGVRDLDVDEALMGLSQAPSQERKRIPISGSPQDITRQLVEILQGAL